jgi:hypothetical protein
MKKSDLRIGNWVFDSEGFDYRIQGYELYVNLVEDFKPIPLSEEWLERLGFGYNNFYQNFRIKAGDDFNSIKYFEGEWCYNNYESDAGCYFVTTVQYVHELQNLYHAINKEELKDESTRSDSDKQN